MDCPHKQTKTFSLFVTTYILPREEINRRANTYKNFLNKDGTPKSKNRHKVKGKYTLSYYRNKVVDPEVRKKFEKIRRHIIGNPAIQEEYTKRRLSYWLSNRCLYTLEPHRKTLHLRVSGKRNIKGIKQRVKGSKTHFLIKNNSNIEKLLALV